MHTAWVLCVADLTKQETRPWKLGPNGRYSSPLTFMSASRNSLYSRRVQHRKKRAAKSRADGRKIGREVEMGTKWKAEGVMSYIGRVCYVFYWYTVEILAVEFLDFMAIHILFI